MVSALNSSVFGGCVLSLVLGCATAQPQTSSLPAASAPIAPAQIQRWPSLQETGRIAGTNVAVSGLQIQQARADGRLPPEKRAESVDDPRESPPAADSGDIDRTVLKREIRSRFVMLNSCPREVARQERIDPEAVRARRLTLRWTILPSGQVTDTAVVATSLVSAGVMDCVKRQMGQWSFVRPRGGAVRIERPFAFRSAGRR